MTPGRWHNLVQKLVFWSTGKRPCLHALFLAMVGLRLFGIMQHEVQRVEFSPFLVARDAASFWQMLDWQRYLEGFPLWPSLLYILKTLGLISFLWVQVLHITFSVLLLFLIIYGLPRIPIIIRALMASSYFLMYEYTALPRSYLIMALLLGIYLWLELREKKSPVWQGLALFLMVFSNIFGLVAAVALATGWCLSHYRQVSLKKMAVFISMVILGVALVIPLAFQPPEDFRVDKPVETYRETTFVNGGIPRLLNTTTHITLDGFLYMPDFNKARWWPTKTLFRQWLPLESDPRDAFHTQSEGALGIIVTILTVLLVIWLLWRLLKVDRGLALSAALLWSGLFLIYFRVNPGEPRHLGLIVLPTLGILALAQSRGASFRLTRPWQIPLGKIMLYIVLVVSSVAGFWALYAEHRDVFSQGDSLAAWLRVNYPGEVPIVSTDYTGQAICARNGGKIYSLEARELRSFERLDTKRLEKPAFPGLVEWMDLGDDGRILILSANSIDGSWHHYDPQTSDGAVISYPLAHFYPSVWWDEIYWVQRVYNAGRGSEPTWVRFVPAISGLPARNDYQDGQLHFETKGSQVANFTLPMDMIDPEVGFTAEVKLKLQKGPTTDHDGAIFSVQTGRREAKLSFFEDKVEIYDQNELKINYVMDTTDDFHTYRLAIIHDILRVYVDTELIAWIVVDYPISSRALLFGDFSSHNDQNMAAEVEYTAYAPHIALDPEGSRLKAERPPHIQPSRDLPWTYFEGIGQQSQWDPSGPWIHDQYIFSAVSNGILTLRTVGQGWIFREPEELNNATGWTAEIRFKLIKGEAGFFTRDGMRGIWLLVSPAKVVVRDWLEPVHTHEMDTTNGFHTYRLCLRENDFAVFIDGAEIISSKVHNAAQNKGMEFGDRNPELGGDFDLVAQIDYIAYFAEGAITPDGEPLRLRAVAPPPAKMLSPEPVDLGAYTKIPEYAVSLEASDFNLPEEGPDKLLDGDTATYWHVKYPPKNNEHWLLIDLKRPISVAGIRVMPRQGYPDQFWDGPNAELQGSHDQSSWQTVAVLPVSREEIINGAGWLTFEVSAEQPFQYYRLLIRDNNFLSLAELELLVAADELEALQEEIAQPPPPPPVTMMSPEPVDLSAYTKIPDYSISLEASDLNSAQEGPDKLLDGDTTTCWHSKWPPETSVHTLSVELSQPQPLKAIRLKTKGGGYWIENLRATLEVSPDGVEWTPLATFGIDTSDFDKEEPPWLYYLLEQEEAFQYYRLTFPYEGILALAELELYQPHQELPDQVEYKPINIEKSAIKASSINSISESQRYIVDGKPETYWHVKYPPKNNEHWLLIDLRQPISVAGIRVIPRQGYPGQFWNGPNAELQGSHDQSSWQTVAVLPVSREEIINGAKWLAFEVSAEQPFQYYRLLIRDDNFLSLAELELLTIAEQSESSE